MKNDPKQIVTPYAFEVHPDLLGIPLATPKRRLLALLIDLLIAAFLSLLGNMILALATAVIFISIAVRSKNDVLWQNVLRYSGAAIASIFVFIISLGVLESTSNADTEPNVQAAETVDWSDFAVKMNSTDFTDENDLDKLEVYAEKMEENAFNGTNKAVQETKYDSLLLAQLSLLQFAISSGESTVIDSIRAEIAGNLAAPEISDLKSRNEIFAERIDDMENEIEDLQDEVENPGFLKTMKATGDDFGLTVGWVGVYFIISLAFFEGRTAGKKLLGLKVVRLNNKPIGIWYSFERFGGYAAGIATGLLGFFQVFWDANRQGIHDKIASTVVVDLRDKKKTKFQDISEQVLRSENLLEDEEDTDEH